MVDISSQEKKINIKIQSGGVQANVGVTQDTAQYYSEKSREWAISNRIVDNTDYSSKYYAEQSKASANEAEVHERSVIEKYNSFIDVSNQAEIEIQALRDDSVVQIKAETKIGNSDIANNANNAISDINASKEAAQNSIDNLAKSYDNLTQRQITNCLLEVPQRIKLELNSESSLVLKTGSEYIVPNGFEDDGVTPRFDYVTTDIDIQQGNGHVAQDLYFVRNYSSPKYLIGYHATKCFSGNTAPTGFGTYAFWYDVANNLVKWTQDSGATWTSGYSLPVGLTTGSSNNVITSIDQVFNGMGYIGSTLWIDKGIKGLCPDEFNEDGTYKSIEINTTKLTTVTNPFGAVPNPNSCMALDISGSVGVMHRYIESAVEPTTTYTTWYNPTTNKMLYRGGSGSEWGKQDAIPVASLDWTYVANPRTNTFTSLVPKQPFHAVDYNDFSKFYNDFSKFYNDFSKFQNSTLSRPDYSSITAFSAYGNYTPTYDCLFISYRSSYSDDAYLRVKIGNTEILGNGTGNYPGRSDKIALILTKGTTFNITTNGTNYTSYIVPLK